MLRDSVGCSPASDALFLTTFPALPFTDYTFDDPSDDPPFAIYLSEPNIKSAIGIGTMLNGSAVPCKCGFVQTDGTTLADCFTFNQINIDWHSVNHKSNK